ncbi:response regulator transcription factor [Candidatus Kaiserbacteria bacterium]|nr:response regulator transcription factor [Candidatus Kaiserbacteria bacterium]
MDPKKKILIIDDNKGILFALEQALKAGGYDVSAWDSFKGMDPIRALDPDLILLDVFLVGADGRAVAQEIKSNAGTKNIPVIMITAYPNGNALMREAKADDCLAKPFDLKELYEKAARYTSGPMSAAVA